MTLKDLVIKNRSYRRFYEEKKIDYDTLKELVDLARLAPSGKNMQHFKYHIANTVELCNKIYPLTHWAGLIHGWNRPPAGERPAAFITMLLDTTISSNPWHDEGFAAQNITLGAVEKGLGTCVIAAVNKNKLKEVLNLPAYFEIVFTIAIGIPKENVVIDEIDIDKNTNYWRDEKQVHHVPKRKLNDIIINL